ncbi:hypothetical protein GYH30_019292 [Glycine max]|nr:hypothetical protein GYH30_019292 [Glycine max]
MVSCRWSAFKGKRERGFWRENRNEIKVGYKYRGREGFGCSLCSEDVVLGFHSKGQNFTTARATMRASPAIATMPMSPTRASTPTTPTSPAAPTSSKTILATPTSPNVIHHLLQHHQQENTIVEMNVPELAGFLAFALNFGGFVRLEKLGFCISD